MVVLPTVYHGSVARSMTPHLRSGQVVVLHPGATGGALEVRTVLQEEGCKVPVTVAETDTLLYACRSPRAGEAIVYGIKDRVNVASLPAAEAPRVARSPQHGLPQYTPAANVLVTSLTNGNAMMHPAPTLLNAGRIESERLLSITRRHYAVYRPVIETIDAERLAVARSLDVCVPSTKEWYTRRTGSQGATCIRRCSRSKPTRESRAQSRSTRRYLFEDIPTGLVPLSRLGRAMAWPFQPWRRS